jgi:hypothetical protein
MVGGLWITDANFKSTIFLKNNVETDPLDVTPILYLSNGHKYTLHGVHLEPAGVAVISINQALADQGIASWATLTGYVEIQYTWPWNAICVSIEDVDVVHSVIFSFGLRSSVVGADSTSLRASTAPSQVFEGMWWKQENNVTGFVALSNTSSEQIHASIQTEDDQSRIVGEHAVTVSPKGTKLVNLTELQQIGSKAGGVRVAYIGAESALLVNGGLEDRSVGYSAAIPFSPAAPQAKNASPMRYAELGLMTGAADPMMLFPVETVFTPYSVLRNVSAEPITVTPTLWWMEGASSHSKRLNDLAILPRRTEVLDVASLLTAAGLKDFNGGVSLTLDVQSSPGGLLMAAGSVDQKNTYVFEVRPTAIQESQGRSLSYWDTANGDDTMVTVWNPADEDQQFVFKLSFTGGDYSFPIHLGPKALYTFNISEVINNQIPDSAGNIIPSSVHAGSAELEGTQGENEDILVAFDAGTYNVVKATCIMRCTTCHGATSFWVQTVPFGVPVSSHRQLNAIEQIDSGGQIDLTTSSSWSSSATSIASVSSGLVSGLSGGDVTITTTSPTLTQAGTDCQPYTPPPCPRTPMQAPGSGTVQVPTSLLFLNVTVLPNGQGLNFGCSGLANYGIRVDIKYQVLDQKGSPILSADMTPHEHGTRFSGSPYDSNIGPSGFTNSTATTAADGTFHDVPFGVCANGVFSSLTATQFITMIMPDGSAPSVRGQTFTATGQSAGHGTLQNSVGDISATR